MRSTTDSTVRHYWMLILAGTAIMMVTMGTRATTGLFLSPINTSTGLGIVKISLAMAIGQFVWGACQPVFGAISDKYGAMRCIVAGGLMLALGSALTPFVSSEWGLILTLGVITAAGAGAGSFSILIGAIAQRLPAERRSFAAGFVNAGGSFGQFVFAPLVQAIISAAGWVSAMMALAVAGLATIPLALPLSGKRPASAATPANQKGASPTTTAGASKAASPATGEIGLVEQVRIALADRSYLLLHAGFFTCGFHVAFLVTHLPGEVALCGLTPAVSATSLALIGLFNIAGSLAAGMLGSRYRMKNLLALMYASRAVLIVLYLAAPKTPITFYAFAAGLGFTWLATVPPTAGIVGKLFGTRYLATLFGLTLLSHQIGGFFGAWLGGITFASSGNYMLMWYADIALALLAAIANLPIREAAPIRRPQAQPA